MKKFLRKIFRRMAGCAAGVAALGCAAMRMMICVVAAGLAAVSCAPMTPEGRISAHPERFAALPERHQTLVRQGELAKGMSPDAVLLAWGEPARRLDGFQLGKAAERWDYAGTQPVYTTTFYGGYGYGYGRHGRHHPYGTGWGPSVEYVPYRRASVWFVNHRVEGWERAR